MLLLVAMHGMAMHLKLAPGLLRKLAARFVGPFRVVAAIGAMSFHLELPS